MGRPTYAKLKLSSEIAPKELEWGEQKIEIKQYISIQNKLNMISEVLNLAADDNRFYNPGKINMFFALKVLDYLINKKKILLNYMMILWHLVFME